MYTFAMCWSSAYAEFYTVLSHNPNPGSDAHLERCFATSVSSHPGSGMLLALSCDPGVWRDGVALVTTHSRSVSGRVDDNRFINDARGRVG